MTEQDIHAEVVQHHLELARWLGTEADPALLESFGNAHHRDLALVAIDGIKLDVRALVDALAGARNAVPGLEIAIEEFELLVRTPEVAVCRFLERHSVEPSRRVTAVLVPEPAARNGLRWFAVHETAVR